ncbi:hypothetical protein WJX73_005130 [Symbiochloris irregularis]|uniref:Uncharacterized protein n=1 Tax=Symbiochloris irregularis TaxID=706552 RepID=A0AAW1PW16_9CHLO
MRSVNRCPAAAGWQERIVQKTASAGVFGAVGGALLSVSQQAPLLRFSATTAASCTFCMACFSVLVEGVRLLRCQDSPANSILAGGLTGYGLTAVHRGAARAGPASVWWAAAGGLAHVASDSAMAHGGFQGLLTRHLLLDPPEGVPQEVVESEPWDWLAWVPFLRKMSDDDWEAYQQKQQGAMSQRYSAVTDGNKQQQQQQEAVKDAPD